MVANMTKTGIERVREAIRRDKGYYAPSQPVTLCAGPPVWQLKWREKYKRWVVYFNKNGWQYEIASSRFKPIAWLRMKIGASLYDY